MDFSDLEGAPAKKIWERLAAEMKARREAAGLPLGEAAKQAPWSRTHLSNLENGRGKPTAEVAKFYDDTFGLPDHRDRLQCLQALAAAADEREKRLKQPPRWPAAVREPEVVPAELGSKVVPAAEASGAPAILRGKRVLMGGGLAFGAAIVAVIAVGLLRIPGSQTSVLPRTGARVVCAEDLIIRSEPGRVHGGEPRLKKGELFDVDRYTAGQDGQYTYAHGFAHGAVLHEGWVIAKWLCDQPRRAPGDTS